MSGYRALYSDFWESPRVLDMKADERLLFVYLITAPGAHYCGVYHCTLSKMVEETGLTEEKVRSALDTLSNTLCVDYDYPMRTVFVHNLAKKEVKSPQQVQGAKNYLKEKIRSIPILEKFSTLYPDILPASDIPYSIGYPIPSPNPSVTDIDRDIDRDTVSQESEPREKVSPPDGGSPKQPPKAEGFSLEKHEKQVIPFDEIVNEYNRICVSLRKCRKLSDVRKRDVAKIYRLLDHDMEQIRLLFTKAQNSAFCRGEKPNERHPNFQADFAWLMKEEKALRTLEGKYDDKNKYDGIDEFGEAKMEEQ